MELAVGVCAYATRAVSDTTPTLDKITPRTRQATPSPRTSRLQSFIPHTPFVVPFEHPGDSGHPRERSSLSQQPLSKHRRLYRLFPVVQPPPLTPERSPIAHP